MYTLLVPPPLAEDDTDDDEEEEEEEEEEDDDIEEGRGLRPFLMKAGGESTPMSSHDEGATDGVSKSA